MPCIMYDLNSKGEKVGVIYLEQDRPEKVYKDYCDEYGDKRDYWEYISDKDKEN